MRFQSDKWNQLKNTCSKVVGAKKKNKEADGDTDEIPSGIVEKLRELTAAELQVGYQVEKNESLPFEAHWKRVLPYINSRS